MSDQGYTPTTEEVRSTHVAWCLPEMSDDYCAEFDRWLAEVRREAAEEAFDHALTCLRYPDGEAVEVLSVLNPYRKEESK